MFLIERFRKLRARMRADAVKGSAALEFAFVAPVFFVLLMGTFEAAIMYFSQALLQNAMNDMGRMIRTGQVNCYNKDPNDSSICQSDMTQAQFRTMLCNKISGLIPCNENLQIDVAKFTNYGGVNRSPLPTDPATGLPMLDANNANLNRYETGAACEVVLARAFYGWPVASPGLSYFLVNMSNHRHLVTAATAFRNEPYNSGTSGC